MFKQNILAIATILFLNHSLLAQNPKYDSTFGSAGKVNINLGSFTNEIGTRLALTNDKKIVCVGHDRSTNAAADKFIVARYTEKGVLDKTFNGTGFNAIELIPSGSKDFGYGIASLPDNSVVAVGYASANTKTSVVVVKYKADGTLDNSFGGAGNGRAILNFGNSDFGRAVIALPNGKLLIGCKLSGAPGVIMLNANGTLDTSYNGTGFSDIGSYSEDLDVTQMTLDNEGRVILTGEINNDNPTNTNSTDMFFIRFKTNGEVDGELKRVGKTGKLETCYDIVQEADGNFLMVGTRNNPSFTPAQTDTLLNLIVRVDKNGNFVKEFVRDFGVGLTESFKGVALQKNGTIIVVGNVNQEYLIVRFKKDLTLDASFSQTKWNFGFKTELNSVAINSNEQIIALGYYIASGGGGDNNFILAKLNTELTPISTFEADNNSISLNLFPNPTSNSLNINYQLPNSNDITIEIYDLLGKKVASFEKGFRTTETQTEKIELSDLENGTYICRIVTKDGASNRKFTLMK